MKISSIDDKSWLSIEPKESEGYYSFEVEAFVDVGHGSFDGKNIDVHFLNHDQFLEDYDGFISNRAIKPILNGTYDSYFKFVAGRGNSIFFYFNVGDSFSGYSETVDFSLKGEFEINSEYLNTIHKEFKKVLKYA